MKIEIGSQTKTIEIRTPQQFVAAATRNPMLNAQVFSVTDAHQHNDLLKKLGSTVRPYALCVLTVSGK